METKGSLDGYTMGLQMAMRISPEKEQKYRRRREKDKK
jgi:hypothetical protein